MNTRSKQWIEWVESQYKNRSKKNKKTGFTHRPAKNEYYDLIKTQKGLCALSKLKMDPDMTGIRPQSAWDFPEVDHVDPDDAKSGIRIVASIINDMKHNLSDWDFERLLAHLTWSRGIKPKRMSASEWKQLLGGQRTRSR